MSVRNAIAIGGLFVCGVSGCLASELAERASTTLGCSGGRFLQSSAREDASYERGDGTAYRFCCRNDSTRCADYFCSNNSAQAGCQRLE